VCQKGYGFGAHVHVALIIIVIGGKKVTVHWFRVRSYLDLNRYCELIAAAKLKPAVNVGCTAVGLYVCHA